MKARFLLPLLFFSTSAFAQLPGMDTLAAALNQVNARGGTVSVYGASARILRLLRITHMDGLVTILPPPDTAATVAVGGGVAVWDA